MIEQVKEEGQAVVVVDVAVGDDLSGGDPVVFTEIIDKGIDAFKRSRMIESDQHFSGSDVGKLVVDGQGVVAGHRTDHKQIIFFQCIQQIGIVVGGSDDADELAGRQDLLLEKLAGVRRIFGGQDDDLFGAFKDVEQFLEGWRAGRFLDVLAHCMQGIKDVFMVVGMIGIVLETVFMPYDFIQRGF